MQEEQALDFYDRIVSGTDRYETIDLQHSSGATLEGVQMHPVDKKTIASVIQRLPDSMFEAVEEADGLDEAEEMVQEQQGGNLDAVTEETVEAFEDLCKESLMHDKLTPTQMKQIVDELSFETLFELGTEIIDMSVESTGAIQDFQKRA